LTYSCRRKTTNGRCPRPVHVSKPNADRFVEETIIDVLERGGVHVVVSARELEAARAAAARASEEREAFVRLASALDPDDFQAGYSERKAREAEALDAYDALLAQTSSAHDLPADATGWRDLDERAQREIARSLISAVVVSPPLSRSPLADPAERFTIRWPSAGQVAGAGR
jgi:hypothetical protein